MVAVFRLFPLSALCAALALGAPEVPEKPASTAPCKTDIRCRKGACWKAFRAHHAFAWSIQGSLPVRELRDVLDGRTGLGLGAQWYHGNDTGLVRRTRLEWNVFSEGGAVGPTALRTKASNYVLSFDHLWHPGGHDRGFYVLGGLGGVRWFTEQRDGLGLSQRDHTTKLAVSAGAGLRLGRVILEGRYLASSIRDPFDGNLVQGSAALRF